MAARPTLARRGPAGGGGGATIRPARPHSTPPHTHPHSQRPLGTHAHARCSRVTPPAPDARRRQRSGHVSGGYSLPHPQLPPPRPEAGPAAVEAPLILRPNPRARTRVNGRGGCLCVPAFLLPPTLPAHTQPQITSTRTSKPSSQEHALADPAPPSAPSRARVVKTPAPSGPALRRATRYPPGAVVPPDGWRHALDQHRADFWPLTSGEAVSQTKVSWVLHGGKRRRCQDAQRRK